MVKHYYQYYTEEMKTLEELMEPAEMIAGIDRKTYARVHHWLRTNYGSANKCESEACEHKSTNYEWALKTGYEYVEKRENFLMLCVPCHRKYDVTELTRIKMRNLGTGRKQKLSTRRKRAQSLFRPVRQIDADGNIIAEFSHIREAQKKTSICNQSITRCAKGRTKFTFWKDTICRWEYIDSMNNETKVKKQYQKGLDALLQEFRDTYIHDDGLMHDKYAGDDLEAFIKKAYEAGGEAKAELIGAYRSEAAYLEGLEILNMCTEIKPTARNQHLGLNTIEDYKKLYKKLHKKALEELLEISNTHDKTTE